MPEATTWTHFTTNELTCHCGCLRMEMEADFMTQLENLRAEFGHPMPVTSGFRCPSYNLQASATGLSGPHTTGRAVDVQVAGAAAHRLMALAIAHGFTGIGLSQKGPHAQRFVHLDAIANGPGRPRPTIWSY